MSAFTRIALTAVALVGLVGFLGGCSQAWAPAKSGWCKDGREWVPAQKQADGKWKDGYCREAK